MEYFIYYQSYWSHSSGDEDADLLVYEKASTDGYRRFGEAWCNLIQNISSLDTRLRLLRC
jgi:hypothetical protein